MKYFLDSAKLDEIKYAYNAWGIDGVTTNPKHIQASGKSLEVVLSDLAQWVQQESIEGWETFPISIETDPYEENVDKLVEDGKRLSFLCPNFVVKIACTEAGVIAARRLEKEGIRTNVTLVFSPSQAMLPAKNNSLFVSPFVGWKENSGEDCSAYIQTIVDIYQNYEFETEIIVAALRNGKQIAEAALAGADIVTCGLQVYKDSIYHPFTDYGLNVFRKAWDGTKK